MALGPITNPSSPVVTNPQPATDAGVAHRVLVSIGVLIGAAFVLQGVADAGPQAHTFVVVLLVGVIILLSLNLNATGHLRWLTTYPWAPPPGG